VSSTRDLLASASSAAHAVGAGVGVPQQVGQRHGPVEARVQARGEALRPLVARHAEEELVVDERGGP